ncbi:type II secretion system protein GspM [Dongshaea marina]|uniref:type II secretion system protein GspM n=1 Tax=Dongshaea marina TaxID=2047966 RepID=UPI000D3E8C9F|nr:type II secretion system protein GspM [Dongshaea marina]
MKERWLQLSARVASMSERERLLIFIAGVVLVLFVGYLLFIEPLWISYTKARSSYWQQQQTQLQTQQSIRQNELLLKADPDVALKRQQQQVQQQIKAVDQSLKELMISLIPPHKMTRVLERMLAYSGKLKLISLKSLAPSALQSGEKSKAAAVALYRHGIELKLEGNYLDIYHYLAALRKFPEHFYWERMDYRVLEYPQAEVTIELYTLSTSKDFISG